MPRWAKPYRKHTGGRKGFGTRGAAEVSSTLHEMGDEIVKAAADEIRRQAEAIAADARTRCPVDTGALRDSIKVTPSKDGLICRISANARNSKGKAWPNFAYGQIVEFAPPDKGGRPFLYPAFDARKDAAQAAIADAVRQAAQRARGV